MEHPDSNSHGTPIPPELSPIDQHQAATPLPEEVEMYQPLTTTADSGVDSDEADCSVDLDTSDDFDGFLSPYPRPDSFFD